MDKKELILLGLFTLLALFVLFRAGYQPEVVVIEQPAPVIAPAAPPMPVVVPEIPKEPEIPEEHVVEIPPEVPFPVPEPPKEITPSEQELMPTYLEFFVNRIPITEYSTYTFIPIKEKRITTYSGKFGPYIEDNRKHVFVKLCSHIRDRPEMYACENIRELNYIDGYYSFVRGFPEDEFIGNVAMKNFGAYYTVHSKEHGMLAQSSVAPIRIVKD
jgi:hypothetical protein